MSCRPYIKFFGMVLVIYNLARNQDSISVVKVLNAGGKIAVPSFVLQHDDYFLNPEGEQRSVMAQMQLKNDNRDTRDDSGSPR